MLIDKIWDLFDVNNDGDLDKEESFKFFRYVAERFWDLENVTQEKIEEIFSAIYVKVDLSGEGTLDKKELAEFLQQLAMVEDDLDDRLMNAPGWEGKSSLHDNSRVEIVTSKDKWC